MNSASSSPPSARKSTWRAVRVLVPLLAIAALIWWRMPDDVDRSRSEPIDGAKSSSENPQTGLAEDAEREKASSESAQADVVVRVRNLWDGSPVPNLTITFTTEDLERVERVADSDGNVAVPRNILNDLEQIAGEGEGVQIMSRAADVVERREVWCLVHRKIIGRVVFAGEESANLESVELSFSPRVTGAHGQLANRAPGSAGWFRRNIRAPRGLGPPSADGRFEVQVPAVRGGAVVARSKGRAPAWATITASMLDGTEEMLLILNRAITLAGVLTDESGAPLAGETVQVYVLIRSEFERMDAAAIGRVKASGFTVMRSKRDNKTVHKLRYPAQTDEQGRWQVSLDIDGDAYAVVRVDGMTTDDVHIGMVSERINDVPIQATPTMPRRIRFLVDGRPAAHADVSISDFTTPDLQPAFSLRTNGAGYVTTTWIRAGRRYGFAIARSRTRFMRYSGQSKIDWADCEESFDKFLGR